MHKTIFKNLLIPFIIVFLTLPVSADDTSPGETKDAVSAQSTASTPQSTAKESKPVETTAVRQSTKIGYVDIARIASESDRGKALKTLLMAKKDQLMVKIDKKKKQIEKLKTSIEAKISTMTPQQREAKSKEFQKKLEEFQKFAQTSEEELLALQEKETRVFYEEIEKSSVAYGNANGLSVIVVKKELLYVGSDVDAQDVTGALIEAFRKHNTD